MARFEQKYPVMNGTTSSSGQAKSWRRLSLRASRVEQPAEKQSHARHNDHQGQIVRQALRECRPCEPDGTLP